MGAAESSDCDPLAGEMREEARDDERPLDAENFLSPGGWAASLKVRVSPAGRVVVDDGAGGFLKFDLWRAPPEVQAALGRLVRGHGQRARLGLPSLPANGSSALRDSLTEKAMKVLGATEDEVGKTKAMKRLGVTPAHLDEGDRIIAGSMVRVTAGAKAERTLGTTEGQIRGQKALGVLGTDDEEYEERISQELGLLGIDNPPLDVDEGLQSASPTRWGRTPSGAVALAGA